jgi:hypothetical protein
VVPELALAHPNTPTDPFTELVFRAHTAAFPPAADDAATPLLFTLSPYTP